MDQLDFVEDKFIVEVHHSEKGKRKFRVRARHHVSKLLAAVCQDFELDMDRSVYISVSFLDINDSELPGPT